jgi:hypothetical protein
MATDEFTNYYTNLLDGSYDCVDRMVLNANFGLCYSPGGFRSWWRRLHNGSDAELDNAHLMRMAGRFSRRVRGWAQAHDVPVIDCGREERKHLMAEEHLKKNPLHSWTVLDSGGSSCCHGVGRKEVQQRGSFRTWKPSDALSITIRSTSWILTGRPSPVWGTDHS